MDGALDRANNPHKHQNNNQTTKRGNLIPEGVGLLKGQHTSTLLSIQKEGDNWSINQILRRGHGPLNYFYDFSYGQRTDVDYLLYIRTA